MSPNRSNFRIPGTFQMAREVFGLWDATRLLLALPELLGRPKANGQRVIVLPGYAANDKFTLPLRAFLTHLGYRAEGWGLGFNDGNIPRFVDAFSRRLQQGYAATAEQVILIGWSLGGYLAREAARDNQELVRKVVTLGSPLVGGAKYTAVAGVYGWQHGLDMDNMERDIDERNRVPLRLPLLSLYSKADNVVSWEASVDNESPSVVNQEIDSTHIGLLVNAQAYHHIERFLAAS